MNNIEFKFIINKQANHYFFVSNLSEWHFSNRPKYNELWLKKFGPLSREEISALKEFRKIRKKYPDSRSIFEKSFFLSKKPYETLKRELTDNEIQIVKESMNFLKNKFDTIYKEDLLLLKRWKIILSENTNNSNRNKKIVEILETFYNAPLEKNKSIYCFLLLNPTTSTGGGGANIDDKSITCEVSHRLEEQANHINGVLWHETIHLLFDNKSLMTLLKKYFKKDLEKVFMYRELIASSLFPSGILGNIFLELKITNNLYKYFSTSKETSARIINLSKKYIKNGLSIDKKYLDQISILMEKG